MIERAGFLLAFLLTFLVTSPSSISSSLMDSSRVGLFLRIQHLICSELYHDAGVLCDSVIEADPDDPAALSFKAAAQIAEMIDSEEALYKATFTGFLDSIEAVVEPLLNEADPESLSWLYLLQGQIRSYRALYESRFGSFVTAVRYGMKARSAYQEGLEADSGNYDNYFGIGSYHYWKSAKAGILRWLMVFRNEKKKGIAELLLAADSGLLFREAARGALIWVRCNEEEYDSAIALAQEFVSRYPDSKSFLWPLARAYAETGQYRAALATYEDLRTRLVRNPGNYFNLIEVDYLTARCYERLRLTEEAAAAASRVSEYDKNIPEETRRRQRANLKYLRRLERP